MTSRLIQLNWTECLWLTLEMKSLERLVLEYASFVKYGNYCISFCAFNAVSYVK